ncbi:dynactin subunit 4 [Neodiprion pinetum]|uniref:dynactin subunit 4 n=1 Tax=Neodiprion pinetum TaxID=441929 RepID=UPI001EDF773B|nr:dynactin subunit 4 [Neodiprion pinetum]XP_046625627.1 dynactin subunit 4 [Neodiprion virginianus]
MAYLFQPDYVRYVCSCGSVKPVSKIYFCRHCLKVRCGYCVCHEVDSHYCSNCMENLPSPEVRLKKNKCSNCFECPCCFQTLSTRAAPAPVRAGGNPSVEDTKSLAKPPPKKVYYLSCSFCRWTSRDAGIPDQFVATGGWPEQENPHSARIVALLEYHKILASRERQQSERKKFHPKRTYMQFEKFAMSSVMVRKRAGLCPLPQSQQSDYPQPAVASEEVEELSPDIFTQPLDITKITTLEQRLKHPDVQAEEINQLRPQHKQFLMKRSQRCRVCEHNVCKPEYSPQSIKFKIQLAAFYHIPEVRIVTCEPLRIGQTSELLLKLCNPTQHQTQIMLFPLSTSITPTTVTAAGTKEVDRENMQLGCESPNLLPSLVRQITVTEDPKPLKLSPQAEIILPESILILPPRDDAAEYDDTGDTHNFQDDPKLVVWRKGNKAVIRLHVKPNEDEQIEEGKEITVGFVMQYGYVNTIATLEHKEPQKLDLKIKLFLSIGKLVGST